MVLILGLEILTEECENTKKRHAMMKKMKRDIKLRTTPKKN